jgi:hypothetical protein
MDLPHDVGLLAAVEPDRVVERGCADLGHAGAALAMAGDAVLGEDRLAAGHSLGIAGVAGQGKHILGDIEDLIAGQDLVGAEPRHLRIARLLAAVADAVGDRVLDVGEGPAPEPVVVGQGRKEALPGPAEPVAGGAVVGERDPAGAVGVLHELGIGLDLLELLGLPDLGRGPGAVLLGRRDLGRHGGALVGAKEAGKVAPRAGPGRVEHPPDDGEDEASPEGQHPPPGRRHVELADAVPFQLRRRLAEGEPVLLGLDHPLGLVLLPRRLLRVTLLARVLALRIDPARHGSTLLQIRGIVLERDAAVGFEPLPAGRPVDVGDDGHEQQDEPEQPQRADERVDLGHRCGPPLIA